MAVDGDGPELEPMLGIDMAVVVTVVVKPMYTVAPPPSDVVDTVASKGCPGHVSAPPSPVEHEVIIVVVRTTVVTPTPSERPREAETPSVALACTFKIVLLDGPLKPTPTLPPVPGLAVIEATTHPLRISPPFVQDPVGVV